MKKRKSTFAVALLVAVLMLAIGYALIDNTNLNITGSINTNANSENFNVNFKEVSSTSVEGHAENADNKVTATVSASGTTATMNVAGLATPGDYAEYTFTIENNSAELRAEINSVSASITGDYADYFSIDATELKEVELNAKDKTGNTVDVTVKVTLAKTPATDDVNGTVDVQFTASPLAPAQ